DCDETVGREIAGYLVRHATKETVTALREGTPHKRLYTRRALLDAIDIERRRAAITWDNSRLVRSSEVEKSLDDLLIGLFADTEKLLSWRNGVDLHRVCDRAAVLLTERRETPDEFDNNAEVSVRDQQIAALRKKYRP